MKQSLIMLVLSMALAGCGKDAPPAAPSAHSSPSTSSGRLEPFPVDQTPSPTAVSTGTFAGLTAAEPLTVRQIEERYAAAHDIYSKLLVLNQLSDLPPSEAMGLLMRLFEQEEDPELRAELLYSLLDIEGEVPAKLDFLALALQPTQPFSVRITAIELLANLHHEDALAILQNFLTDPDPEIRQAVSDAVELVRSALP